jgi:hypothetical protein
MATKEGTLTRVRYRKDSFLIASLQTRDNELLTVKGDTEIAPELGDHLSGTFTLTNSTHGPTWVSQGMIKVEHPKFPAAIKQRFADLAKKAGVKRTKKFQEEVAPLEASEDAWMALMTLANPSESMKKVQEAFSACRTRIEAKTDYVEMVHYLRDLGLSWKESTIKSIFGFKADCENPDAIPITVAQLQEDPFLLFEVAKLRKTQWEEYGRALQDTSVLDKESLTHLQLALALKQQEEEGHTCIPLKRVKFPLNPDNKMGARFLTIHNDYVFRRQTFHAEHGIANILAEQLMSVGIPRMEITMDWLREIVLEYVPTEEQYDAVYKMLTEPVQIVLGSAGTGKTTTLKLLLAALKRMNVLEYLLLAPTGKAVQRIRESVSDFVGSDRGEVIQTIHKFSYSIESFYKDEQRRRQENRVPSYIATVPKLIVIDEMSMVDNHTLSLFLNNVSRLCQEEEADFPHLVFIGDTNQLGPIGAGEPLLSMIDSELVPVHRLTVIQRQKEGHLMDVVNTVRTYNIPSCVEANDCAIHPYSKETLEHRVKAWIDTHEGYRTGETAAIICPTNAMCETVTLIAREYVNPVVTHTSIRYATEVYGTVRVGDKVIQTKNNYAENVFNGSVGRVLNIKHEQRDGDIMREVVVVEFPTGIRYYSKEEVFDELDLAFALTTHKSQGSEYTHVLFVLEQIPMFVTGNLIYTAMSRAQETLTVLTDKDALSQCRSKPKRRFVYLANFLVELVETEEN